jgi:hypothetical protein
MARKHWNTTPATIVLWAGMIAAIVLARLLAPGTGGRVDLRGKRGWWLRLWRRY